MPPRNMGAGTFDPYAQPAQSYSTPEDRVVHVGEDYFSFGGSSAATTPSRTPFSYDPHPTSQEAGPSYNIGRAALVRSPPAKNLIAEYERMLTPPPPPPPGSSGPAGMLRNKSTRKRQYVYDYRADPTYASHLQTPERGDRKRLPNETVGGLKKDNLKERSPLRQSLRNLFSVIKKGVTKKKSDDGLGVSYPTNQKEENSLEEPAVGGTSQAQEDSQVRAQDQQTPKSGTLLYLSRTEELGGSRESFNWDCCTAALHQDPSSRRKSKLVLSSFGADMQLSVHEISLAGCVDIRSLSMSQLSEDEGKRLDEASVRLEGGLGRLKAFEIKFPGKKAKERFAAKSVKERAGWISAIWDAILPDRESQRKTYGTETISTPGSSVPPTTPLAKKPSIQSPIPRTIPEMSVLLNPSFSQRSPPPVPPETVPPTSPQAPDVPSKESRKPNLHLDIPPPILPSAFSPSVYPPTSAASTPMGSTPLETPTRTSITTAMPPLLVSSSLSSSTPAASLSASTYATSSHHPSLFGASSPPASPSIINLGQLSMVRQRLAQIERNHSEISAKSSGGYSASVSRPGTPMTPTRMRKATSPLGSPTSIRTVNALPTPRGSDTRSSKSNYLPVTRRKSSRRPTEKKLEEVPSSEPDIPLPACDELSDSQPGRSPSPATEDVDAISRKVAEIKNVLGGESGYPTIHQVVLGIESRLHKDSKSLKTVKEKIEQLGGQVSTVLAAGQTSAPSGKSEVELEVQKGVQKAVEDVKSILDKEFPSLSTRLKDIQVAQSKFIERENITELRNVGASKAGASNAEVFDVRPILDKLQELKNLAETKEAKSEPGHLDSKVTEHLENIQNRLQEDSNKQALVSQQQADSVRYLNELNTWLETFVNNGTAQIQGLSMNVYQLCRSLGCIPQQIEPGQANDESSPNLLSDIRQLVEGMQARDQNFAALQTAVHALLEVLSASQQQMGAESQAIAGLIARQRQEQEALLRSFTNEISGEIRGERLRFVEAMKEATAINVQLHVENFKQELGREVMAMTEEVGRLHREKQQVENQISDLFAFYSKHKQDNPLRPIQVNTELAIPRQQVHERPRTNLPRASHHRPLPYPSR